MKDRRQDGSGEFPVLSRSASGVLRRATKKPETFPEGFPKKRPVFPNVSRRVPEQKGAFPEQPPNTSRKNLLRMSKKYGINAGLVWGISRRRAGKVPDLSSSCLLPVFHLSRSRLRPYAYKSRRFRPGMILLKVIVPDYIKRRFVILVEPAPLSPY